MGARVSNQALPEALGITGSGIQGGRSGRSKSVELAPGVVSMGVVTEDSRCGLLW